VVLQTKIVRFIERIEILATREWALHFMRPMPMLIANFCIGKAVRFLKISDEPFQDWELKTVLIEWVPG
jgi:hypothetical protein